MLRRRSRTVAVPPRSEPTEVPPPVRPTPPPCNVVQFRSPTRVLVAGGYLDELAASVQAVADDGGPLAVEDDHGPRQVDAILLGPDVPGHREAALTQEASAAGIPVITPPRFPVIDVRTVNPLGWQRAATSGYGVLFGHPDRVRCWDAIDAVVRRLGPERVVLLVPEPWRHVEARGLTTCSLPTDPVTRGRTLQAFRGVVDLPELHRAAADRARWIVETAARGVPVVADRLDELGGRLAGPLEHAIAATELHRLDDDHDREQASIAQRRRALRHHGAWYVWRELAVRAGLVEPPAPSISVLLSTNRPDHLLEAVGRVDRQHHPRLELIVALHGDGFGDNVPSRLRRATSRPVTVLRQPADRPLGAVLNAATAAASGQLIAKMDDDDLYDADHLTDLVEALRYSGATLVGKGSEYVYLEEVDTTVRRLPRGAESTNRNVAGGTLMLARDDLQRVGWWQQVPQSVDQRLVDDVTRGGGRLHRTHGAGFILYRRDGGHTWQASADYFLRQAVAQWRGLALDAAGIR
jgi:hypothetical protein